jgi:hypothetical protein
MVAYSFKPRFAELILDGSKRQTIRAVGKRRHARPGDELQLYSGMRTRHCRLIARAKCASVHEVELFFNRFGASELFRVDGAPIGPNAMECFARLDGFSTVQEMATFWWAEHGKAYRHIGLIEFKGVMVRWSTLILEHPVEFDEDGAVACDKEWDLTRRVH